MKSAHEKSAAEVRALELKSGVDEMRCVRLEDGRNTITEIQIRDESGEWGMLGVGLARRRKGDKRDPNLGGSLSLYRALVMLTERHREEYAKRWPEYFPKDTVSADAHAEVVGDLGRARAVAVTLEQQNARALELLRRLNPERRELLEAIAVLAGDDAED